MVSALKIENSGHCQGATTDKNIKMFFSNKIRTKVL